MRNLDPLLKSKSTGLFAPGHSTDGQGNTPSLPVKEVYLLGLELNLRA